MIYVNDHRPAHVHVFCDGREVVIVLEAAEVSIREIDPGMKRTDVREAVRIAQAQRASLLEAWERIDAERSGH